MADIYFPNPIAALPEPRFQEPQSNTGTMALGAALESFTSVANNFRQKEMNVQKANQMADALEKEGLKQEANLYRQAAQSYQVDFFATPQENERFNQSLLNDTLKLLSNKQEREMKQQQLVLEAQYKQAAITNMGMERGIAQQRIDLQRQELELGIDAKSQALEEKANRNKLLGLDATADNFRQIAKQSQDSIEELKKQRDIGSLTQEEFANKSAPYYDDLNKSRRQLNEIQKQMLEIQGINAPSQEYVDINVPVIKSKIERDAEVQARSVPYFAKYPNAKEYTEGNVTIVNPVFVKPTEVTTVTGVDAEGNPIRRKQETQYLPQGAQGTGKLLDPNAPFTTNSRY